MTIAILGPEDRVNYNSLFRYQLYNGKTKQNVVLNAWQGFLSFQVFSNKQPAARVPLNINLLHTLIYQIKKVRAMGPNSAVTVTSTKWDPNTKSNLPVGRIIVGKNDENVMTLTLKTPDSDNHSFEVTIPASVAFDDDNKQVRAEIGVNTLISVLEQSMGTMITSKRVDKFNNQQSTNNNQNIKNNDIPF